MAKRSSKKRSTRCICHTSKTRIRYCTKKVGKRTRFCRPAKGK